jgi:amino acid transporter
LYKCHGDIVLLIIGLLIAGLVIDLGGGPQGDRIGFRVCGNNYVTAIVPEESFANQYWKHPGAVAGAGLVKNVNTDRFLGILSVLVQAAFSFQGMELVAM